MGNKEQYLVAITGSFSSGKSFVGDILKDLDYLVIDTDKIVSDFLKSKNKITDEIVNNFGQEVISGGKQYINKKLLASIVFSDTVKRKKLESIIHPEVRKEVARMCELNADKNIVFVLIPLLFESGEDKEYDEIWCVKSSESVQLERAEKRGFTKEEAMQRIRAQMLQEEKIKRSHFVIDNDKDAEITKDQIQNRLKEILVNVSLADS